MKGFEICINDAAPIVAMTDSLVTLIISVGYADGDDMHIGGMDSKSNHLIWMNKKMSLGDKIKVRVREIDIASPLHMRYPSDREEMKKEYYKLKKKHTNHTLKKAISLTAATTVLCTGIFTPDFFSTQSVTAKTTSQKTITVTANSSSTTILCTNIIQSIAKAVDTNTTTNVTAKSTTINIQNTMSTTDTTTTEAPASTPAATKKPTSTKTPATTKKPAATKKPVAAKKPQKKKSNITKITISAAGDCTLGSDYKSPSGVNF